MKVTVQFHERVRRPLREWLADLAARHPGGPATARVAVADIRQRLHDSAGRLDGVIAESTRPILYRWEYMPGVRISYLIRDRGFWFWRSRRIIVVEVEGLPSDPSP